MADLKNTCCLSCLASLWGHLQNNGVSPEVIYDSLDRQLKLDQAEFERIKHSLTFEEVIQRQTNIFQVLRFLSLLQGIKAHR